MRGIDKFDVSATPLESRTDMPKKPHGRPIRPHGHTESARQGETAVGEVLQTGRASTAGRAPRGSPEEAGRPSRSNDDLITRSTGEPGDAPEGRPTRLDPKQKAEGLRAIGRENESAAILADNGYRTRQNPSAAEVAQAREEAGDAGDPGTNPDYLVEGRVFDCYAPAATTSVRNIWAEVRKKIVRQQTQRMVLNLQDWNGDLPAIQTQFDDWPVTNLKEVKVIDADGNIVQIHLNRAND